MDIFDTRKISPMLIAEAKEAFDSEEYLYEIKWDGIRAIAYLDEDSTDIRNKRNKMMLHIMPELNNLQSQVKSKCILDGELVVLKGSKPDFYSVQRRAILTDPLKIALSMQQHPVSFIAYDILYYQDKDISYTPLIERKKYLEETIIENERLIVSRYIDTYGIELYRLVEEQKLEGIVAKKKSSLYWQGKRSKDWIKCKLMNTEDCIVCGYIFQEKNMTSFLLGQYKNDKLIYRGNVSLGVTFRKLTEQEFVEMPGSPFGFIPKGYENAVWIKPELICTIEYMPSDNFAFRQPVFKGFRDDKYPRDCIIRKVE